MVSPVFTLAETNGAVADDLVTLAQDDTVRLLTSVLDREPLYVTDLLLATLPSLINPYAVAATELGATAYEELRAASDLSGTFRADTIETPTLDRIETLVRWGVAPLFGQSDSTVEMLLGGGIQKLITNTFRETVSLNSRNDKSARGWERMPSSGACAFCAMVSGNVYTSERSADGFHDFCRCKVVPIFGDRKPSDYPEHMRENLQDYKAAKKLVDARMELKSTMTERADGSKKNKYHWVDMTTGEVVTPKRRTSLYLSEMRASRGGK